MSIAIRLEQLGKQYRIGETHARSVRELVNRAWARLRGQPIRPRPQDVKALGRELDPHGRFWAVRDVSFDVHDGEIVGIIGRNGSGKSTLLKVLSQITPPTAGRVELYGRVASLLEVGTGFHPELTGRENIFLNGAILGMRRAEIQRKLDDIVAFAEIDGFLDTPVKRYSSGMYVRLAFAVAAHLEPEILVVDEVLAVGDAAFQQKCLGKMSDVAHQGRTVLVVSHNMAAVERLCTRAVLLRDGKVQVMGRPADIVAEYLQSATGQQLEWSEAPRTPHWPHIRRAWLCRPDGSPCLNPTSQEAFGVEMEVIIPIHEPLLKLSVGVKNARDHWLFWVSSAANANACPKTPGVYRCRVLFPRALFRSRMFVVAISLHTDDTVYHLEADALRFRPGDADADADAMPVGTLGDFHPACDWSWAS